MDDTEAVERRRRRQLSAFFASFGAPLLVVFAVVDFLEGDRREFLADVALLAILLAGMIAIFVYGKDRQAYRVALNLLSLAVLYNISLGAGHGSALYWAFVLPPILFFFLGRREGLASLVAVLALLCVLLFLPGLLGTHDYGLPMGLRFFFAFLFVAVVAFGLESSRHRFSEMLRREHAALLAEKANLEQAMEQVRTLRGLLPICAHCKKVRDDKGYWKQIESYVHEHSGATFSHGICPECAKKHYPNIRIYDEPGAENKDE